MEKSLVFALCKWLENPTIYVGRLDEISALRDEISRLRSENKRLSALYAQEVSINLALEDKLRG